MRFAGLYYGGHLAAGQGGSPAPSPAARNTVRFKAPGDQGYRSLTASRVDEASSQYQGFVDVTSIVDAAGPGVYTTANVQLGTGLSDATSGGWALVVAYADPAAPSRNLAVFDGMQHVSSSGSVTIPLSGFQTPLSGPVVASVGIVAYEGDLGTTGDGAQLQGASGFTPLSDTVNRATNVFNATISSAGALVTSRVPSPRNNLGYDADLFRTTNVLGNAQTSTQVRLVTNGDAYQPGVVTIATDLYAPQITATKTVTPAVTGLGGTLTYTVSLNNSGQDAAVGSAFSDAIPAGTAFVPGSIRVGGAPVTDAAGDDLGEFAGGRVVGRLGTGASAAAGGTLAPGASATVSFQVTVATSGVAVGTTIDNTADISFQAATTGVASTVTTAPATATVRVPDLVIAKTHAPALAPGADSTYTIEVGNVGNGVTVGPVTVTDTLEPDLTVRAPGVTGGGWACSTAGATITCTRADPLPSRINYPPISIPVTVDPGAQPGQLANTATLTGGGDGNPDNNSVTDAGDVSEPAIDLHVEKAVTNTPGNVIAYRPESDPITYRIEVSNDGIANAANVQLSELLDPDIRIESITPSQGSCSGTTCDLGTITPTQVVTIDVEAFLRADADLYPFDGRRLDNTATVSAPVGNEINPDDNSATASVATLPWSNLAITKTFSPAQPVAGGPVTYTLTVRNLGPGTVDATAGDFVPAAVLNPIGSVAGGTGACFFDPRGENTGGRPTELCDIPQFASGEQRVITIQGTLAPDSAGTPVENVAFIQNFTDIEFDTLDDNIATASFTPGTVDVGIRKTVVGSGTVAAGDVAVFRLVASNSGSVAAHDVTVTDTLPAGLDPVDPPAGCQAAGRTVNCVLGTLAPGAEQTEDVRARANPAAAGQSRTNRASVRAAEADLNAANDAASAELRITTSTDLEVKVTPPTGRVREGDASTWQVTAANRGLGTATGVTLGLRPRGGTATQARVAQAGCRTGAPAGCDLGSLAPGARRTLEITLRRRSPGRLRLDASIRAVEPESRTDNNTDSAEITVRAGRATVSLRKRGVRDSVVAGSTIPFTITARVTGTRDARKLLVCDRPPQGLRLLRARGARLRANVACWRIARLAAGTTRRLTVATRTERDSAGVRRLVNRATLTGANTPRRRAAAAVFVSERHAPACAARGRPIAHAAC